MRNRRIIEFFPPAAAVVVICALAFMVFQSLRESTGDFGRRDMPRAQRINCVNNLKQIGLGFRQWALDNNDQFSFNVSMNAGGSLEFCDRDKDGFDRNAFRHLQPMSNELNTTKILVCPKDRSRKAAADFQ